MFFPKDVHKFVSHVASLTIIQGSKLSFVEVYLVYHRSIEAE